MKFKDVTTERTIVFSMLKNQSSKNKIVKIFSNGATKIIYRNNGINEHVSLSNLKRGVKKREIDYAIKNILKTNPKSTKISLKSNGVVNISKNI
ncbi:DUF1827 family protein [Priestia megaterium]|uniref:DUF1827 family protein n=2 Tax=Priestia megaterium TaxID=1404 RepID=UPI001BEBE323|nr:DUF1827 family protein [Priestia megaterium]MBT2254008.1 DUF1827 family protein [Priestia megaterium]MBT2279261.1 DUF1827 family protein [Priestia megaterium]